MEPLRHEEVGTGLGVVVQEEEDIVALAMVIKGTQMVGRGT